MYALPELAPWYISYVILFNMLVGPVFSAGSVTSERERETLDLLLTTILTPWQILWGKLISGLRVSSVLTMFLLWPVLLAVVMVNVYWSNLPSVLGYLVVVLIVCLTTAMIGAVLLGDVSQDVDQLDDDVSGDRRAVHASAGGHVISPSTFFADSPLTRTIAQASFTSPFAVVFKLPIDMMMSRSEHPSPDWWFLASFVGFYLALRRRAAGHDGLVVQRSLADGLTLSSALAVRPHSRADRDCRLARLAHAQRPSLRRRS